MTLKIRDGALGDNMNFTDTFLTTIVVLDKNIFVGIPADPKFITGRRTMKTEEEILNPEIQPVVKFKNISLRMNKTLANLTDNDLKSLLELGEDLELTRGVKTTDYQILKKLNEMYRTDIETLMHIETAFNYYI
jgi:hypothetical protein